VTPRLLDVLKKHHAKATFFLTSTDMAAHLHLVRRIRDEGHQTGSHTYSDAGLVGLSAPRAGLELALTRNVLGDGPARQPAALAADAAHRDGDPDPRNTSP
jgi:peptidoglycan/xylan/chitin deacetylase (PgdA/CDA1 family)